ncbi:MAG TPA: flagellar export chaperone FliS [Acidimicrobiales bacterium]
MGTNPQRDRYLSDSLATASPQRLLTMLWDRLILDLTVAEDSLGSGDLATASERMLHAQDIVFELRTSLRTDAWAGAHGLAALYAYVESRLVQANIQKDAAIVIECRGHLEPLRDAFREAADIVTAEQAERATLVASA